MWKRFYLLLFVFGLSLFCCGASLQWNASIVDSEHSAPTGYRVHRGTAPGVYDWSVDVGNVLQWPIPDDLYGSYYWAASAYNEAGPSGYSNEVYWQRAPPQYIGATALIASRYQVGSGPMAGAIVQTAGPVDYDGQLTFGSSVTAGNTIIVMMGGRDGNPTVSDSRSNTYAAPLGNHYYASKDNHVKIYYALNVAGGSTTISMSGVWNGSWLAWEMSGLATTGQPDAQAEGDYATGTTPNVSITTTDTKTFLVVACSDHGSEERVLSGVYGDITTSVAASKNGIGFGYANLTSSGTKTAGLTFAATDGWAVQAYAFKLASGGGSSAVKGGRGNLGIMRGMSRLMWIENDFLKPIGGQ